MRTTTEAFDIVDSSLVPDEAVVLRMLERILETTEFARSERLSALLRFIVTHSLENRGARLKAYTIAREVFGRDENFDPATDSVVRVEVGRLRQRLEAYYHTGGVGDELVVEIAKGRYAAAFRQQEPLVETGPEAGSAQSTATGIGAPRKPPYLGVAAAVLGILVVAGIVWALWSPRQSDVPLPTAAPVPASPAATQVARMAAEASVDYETAELYRQAFVLIFAPTERVRLLSARSMFERVSERAPDFGGGYAGASFTHSLAVIFGSSQSPGEDLDAAVRLATEAVERDPNSSLGHAMLGMALVLRGDDEAGIRHSRLALVVQPSHAISHWILGVNLLLIGRPSEAIPSLREAIRLDPADPRTPYWNVLGIAFLASGDFERADESFERNLRRGGPDGVHMSVLRAAAYAELGRDAEARAEIDRFRSAKQEFEVGYWLRMWLRSEADLRRVAANLRRLGLPLDIQETGDAVSR